MTIEIAGKEKATIIQLGDLNRGQVFYDTDGDLCIKTDERSGYDGDRLCVVLETGVIVRHPDDTYVTPVSLKCTVVEA